MKSNLLPKYLETSKGQRAKDIIKACVHCGFCTATCPSYQVLGNELDSPRGRIYLIKDFLEGEVTSKKTQLHLDRCLTCRSCETTCPSGVKYGELIDIGRTLVEKSEKRNKIDNIFAIYQNFFTKMFWTHSLKNIVIYYDNYLKIVDNFINKNNKKIFTVELEYLTTNSEDISKKMFNFCDLEWSEESLEYHKRKDLFSTTASNIQIREKIYEYNKEKYNNYKKYLEKFEQDYVWLKKRL